ncbi:MAG: hypothetical protein WBE83_12895 [Candidatus Cybelea sp.]
MPAVDPERAVTTVTRLAGKIALAAAFAAFVIAKGVPALRHDWNWPLDRLAVPSFLNESISGWLSVGFGIANSHPTTYLLAAPTAVALWLFGTLVALSLLAFATGYCAATGAANVALRLGGAPSACAGAAFFALFNPWVYNEVVAGHLIMVLAYGGLLGLLAEMTRGSDASSVRLSLWLVLIEAQLQFFIVAVAALAVFALMTKKWLPLAAGAIVALPSVVGVLAERPVLLQTPYSVAWQANQSLSPFALLSLGGYFPGYAERLGLTAQIAVWVVCALAITGIVTGRRRRAVLWCAPAAVLVYLVALGVHGPLDAAYEWIVRSIPESGVFRELYDFGGVFAALLVLLASAATPRAKALRYVLLAAGAALPVTWIIHPPSDLWISSSEFPRPAVTAPPFSRVALMPAFQPLQLKGGAGDGADPDVLVYPAHVAALNAYLPSYPVDMALAQYAQYGDASALRALGVAQIVDRPWFLSRSNGGIGLAASSLSPSRPRPPKRNGRDLAGAPLVSTCDEARIVANVASLEGCDLFFGDAPGYARVTPIGASGDSIDAATAWIDARLAFAKAPDLAQGLGGVVTQSTMPHAVQAGSRLLAYVRGRLSDQNGRALVRSGGTFSWISIAPNTTAVICTGLCELAAASPELPPAPQRKRSERPYPTSFEELTPWLVRVQGTRSAGLLRFNERYDPAWTAISSWRVLPHVRLALAANGWLLTRDSAGDVFLVQVAAFLQSIAEIAGLVCVVLLLKALVREPTKRV